MRGHLVPHRFVWRIYLHGLLLLAIVALTIGLVVHSFGGPPMARRPERLARYAAARAAELSWDPAALEDELERVEALSGLPVTLYRPDGARVASSAEPPVPPVPAAEVERVHARVRAEGHRPGDPLPLEENGRLVGYLAVGRPEGWTEPLTRGLTILAAVLFALAVGSLPLALALSRPVEALTRAVRRFGRGDLAARSGIARRDELGELARSFDEMAERIGRLVLGEKELLANVSHELRTPLARIRVALELAREGDLERARRYLGEIGTDLGELETLLENVLTAARLDLSAGRGEPSELPFRRERFAADELLARSAGRFESLHPGHELELRVPEHPVALDGDPTLLRRAIDNLLDNGAKYSAPGTAVGLAAAVDGGELAIEVADRGVGIAPQDLARLFTPFFRGDASRARTTGGVGLGLALAKRIVEAHGGTIAVDSAVGRGTTVRVRLPVATGPAAA